MFHVVQQVYAWITFAGIMSDANTVLHVASEVVGLSPATVTSFRVERPHRENTSDLMEWLRRSRLVGASARAARASVDGADVPRPRVVARAVDRGIGRTPYRIDLDNVSFVREAFNIEGYMICTLYLITSQPTSLLGLLLAPKHRLWAVGLALFSLFKVGALRGRPALLAWDAWLCSHTPAGAAVKSSDRVRARLLGQARADHQPDERSDLLQEV